MSQISLKKILASPKLPTLPAVALRVIALCRDKHVNLDEIARVVTVDQAIAAKVLRTVNSSFYGLSRECTSIRQALAYLGLNTVSSVVLGFSLVESLSDTGKDADGFDYQNYWRRGIYSACAARVIAAHGRICDPEEVFLGCLMQDIGMICLLRACGYPYIKLLEITDSDHRALPEKEKDKFGFDHMTIGESLADKWKLPKILGQVMAHHHDADRAMEQFRPQTRVAELANIAANALDVEPNEADISRFKRIGREWFSIEEETADELLSSITDAANELASLFQITIGETSDVEAIMEDAELTLVETQANIQRQQESLEQSNEELAQLALTDALTGVWNRKFFDQELTRCFDEARDASGCLALLFSDVDRFKAVNDTHGHQVGDAVLVGVAEVLNETIGDAGSVCRYGGEEFAIILPGMDRIAAAKAAEEVRQAIEELSVDLTDAEANIQAMQVTISLGVVAQEPHVGDVISTPPRMVRIADRAVYAAKSAGRNCVRVYNAAPKAVAQAA